MATTKNDAQKALMLKLEAEMIKFQPTVKYAYEENMSEGYYWNAAQIAKDFKLGNDMVKTAAKLAYEADLTNGRYSDATGLTEIFEFTEYEKKAAAENAYVRSLSEGYYSAAAEIAKNFRFDSNLIKGTELLAKYKGLLRK